MAFNSRMLIKICKLRYSAICRYSSSTSDSFISSCKKSLEKRKMTADFNATSLSEIQNSTLLQLPNLIHPDVIDLQENKIVKVVNQKPSFDFKPLDLEKLSEIHDCLEMGSHIGRLMGPQSYYLKNCLVDLEQALISVTLDKLINQFDFELVSVPDLLYRDVIEACGMDTHSERNQVYKIKKGNGDPADVCLSGTAEMALAAMYSNQVLSVSELPIKMASVSRCYRAETSNLKKEKGIFRVHEFTKVEMFAITADESGHESPDMLDHFCSIQTELSESIGLHFKVLDMAPFELGKPAYRKYDIEAWMPGRQLYGEISSASNCTDYQSRRLSIQYKDDDGQLKYAHTVNGTACAIPRMLIAIMESNQQKDCSVTVPLVLQSFLNRDVLMPPSKRVYVTRVKS